jgi:F-type H+-transporting ATPase subunit b
MEINIWQVLFQVVNFGVILFVLNKVLYKPVMKMLDDRAKKINEGMAAAEKNLKEAGEIEKLKKAEIAKARKDAAAILRQAEAEAKKSADEIIEAGRKKAKEEAERLMKNAESEIAASKKAMEGQAVELALAMAKKALSQAMTAAEIEKITKGMLKEFQGIEISL